MAYLDLLQGPKNLRAEGVVVVVDDVFDLPRPVYDNALQVLYQILEIGICVKKYVVVGWILCWILSRTRSIGSCEDGMHGSKCLGAVGEDRDIKLV